MNVFLRQGVMDSIQFMFPLYSRNDDEILLQK